jgi:hypothetical protein
MKAHHAESQTSHLKMLAQFVEGCIEAFGCHRDALYVFAF